MSVTKLFVKETGGCGFDWWSWSFCPDKYGWIKIKGQCSWDGDTWEHCVNNCKFLTADCCWNIQGLRWEWQSEQLIRSINPVLALDLCSVLSRDFTACLQQQVNWLKQKFLDVEVEKIDDQFCKLHLAFKEQSGFKQILQNSQACSTVLSFEQCWSPLRSEFEDLQPCGAIASIMPGTSSKSDFSWSIEQSIPAQKA